MKNVPTYAMALALAVVAFFGYLDRAKVQTLEGKLERARLAELERGFNEATHMSALDPVLEGDGEPGVSAVASTYVRRSGDRMSGALSVPFPFHVGPLGSCGSVGPGCFEFTNTTMTAYGMTLSMGGSVSIASVPNALNLTAGGGISLAGPATGTTTVTATTFLRSIGVSYATLPAAAAGNKGALEYDTTNERLMWSNGTAWAAIPNNGVLSGYTSGSLVANQEIIRARMASGAGYVTRVGATVDVAGTGAGTFTVEAYNVTGVAQICVTGAIPCATAAGGSASVACTGAFALGDDVAVRMNQSGCTTKAELNGYLVFGGGH